MFKEMGQPFAHQFHNINSINKTGNPVSLSQKVSRYWITWGWWRSRRNWHSCPKRTMASWELGSPEWNKIGRSDLLHMWVHQFSLCKHFHTSPRQEIYHGSLQLLPCHSITSEQTVISCRNKIGEICECYLCYRYTARSGVRNCHN